MHSVYEDAGVSVVSKTAEIRRENFEQAVSVADKLLQVLRKRTRFPVLHVPDPAGELDTISVQLQRNELWRDSSEDALPHSSRSTITRLRGRAEMVAPYSDVPEAHRSLGHLTAIRFSHGPEITQVGLARARSVHEVYNLDAASPQNADRPEVLAFIGMVGNYLEQL